MPPTNKERIRDYFQKRWVCQVVRSGFHNGAGCTPGNAHVDWECGYRYEVSLTADQMFKRVYTGDRHITFQTCIFAEGISSWGRLFVVAVPKTDFSGDELRWGMVH